MDRIILMMDTGCDAVQEAAQWFAAHGDTVMIAAKIKPENACGCAEYLTVDPMCDESLQAAVEALKQKHGRLDILIIGAAEHPTDGEIGTGHDYEALTDTLTRNVAGCRRMIEAFQPLLKKGMKRIACITEQESSNGWSEGSADIAYYASLAAVNMLGRMMFNKLRPQGFTFRWYCYDGRPGGMCAADYITSALCYDPKEPYTHSDENRMVLRDAYLRELSW